MLRVKTLLALGFLQQQTTASLQLLSVAPSKHSHRAGGFFDGEDQVPARRWHHPQMALLSALAPPALSPWGIFAPVCLTAEGGGEETHER